MPEATLNDPTFVPSSEYLLESLVKVSEKIDIYSRRLMLSTIDALEHYLPLSSAPNSVQDAGIRVAKGIMQQIENETGRHIIECSDPAVLSQLEQ
jgi:hypothetical protein